MSQQQYESLHPMHIRSIFFTNAENLQIEIYAIECINDK